jgi:hypothetical protein
VEEGMGETRLDMVGNLEHDVVVGEVISYTKDTRRNKTDYIVKACRYLEAEDVTELILIPQNQKTKISITKIIHDYFKILRHLLHRKALVFEDMDILVDQKISDGDLAGALSVKWAKLTLQTTNL